MSFYVFAAIVSGIGILVEWTVVVYNFGYRAGRKDAGGKVQLPKDSNVKKRVMSGVLK